MNNGLVAKVSTTVNAPIAKVWAGLVDPDMIKQFMFGTEAVSDWKVGSSIVWRGIWGGKPYEDKGTILKIEPEKVLEYSHYSPLSGLPDKPENYHNLTFELSAQGNDTLLTLSQDNNSSKKAQEHSKKMWEAMLESIKQLLEK